jgi:integrase
MNEKEDKATAEWLNAQKRSSSYTYKWAWNRFMEYVGMTGDQILNDRKSDKDFSWEQRTLDFKAWLIEQKGQSDNAAKTGTTAVRSFFSYHRLPLKFRRQERKRLTEATRKTEDYRFSVEDLKKMADFGDLTEQYVVVVGKSLGLRAGDFLRLTRGDFEGYLDRPVPISIGEISTGKEKVPAYPFIDSDALPVIKNMIDTMDREGRTEPKARMLKYSDKIALSRVLQRVADKAGIKHGSKKIRFHNLRKFLIDHLSSYMSESKWKQIIGKKIKESAYVSPDSLREDYERAMKETTFTKTVAEGEIEKLAKKMTLMTIAKNAGLVKDEDEMKAIWRSRKAITLDKQIEVLEEITKRKTATDGGCSDGEHCQRLVSEAELPGLLSQGWHAQLVLPSGKIVVSNE